MGKENRREDAGKQTRMVSATNRLQRVESLVRGRECWEAARSLPRTPDSPSAGGAGDRWEGVADIGMSGKSISVVRPPGPFPHWGTVSPTLLKI